MILRLLLQLKEAAKVDGLLSVCFNLFTKKANGSDANGSDARMIHVVLISWT